jgi:Rrf2 family nitric oxide-sensitive transcriptional repressor
MHLTAMTDYALRLLMCMVQHRDRQRTIAEVAQACQVSAAHVMRFTHPLTLGGWLQTKLDKGGQRLLARRARGVDFGSFVCSVEPSFFLVECFATGSTCTLTGRCRLAGVIQDALHGFMDGLDHHTLADVLPSSLTIGTSDLGKHAKSLRLRPA